MEIAITGGKYKGRKISVKSFSQHLRPTLSKIRESVFDILGNDLADLTFVDAFAGSGIMGMEAISRNAKKVYFFETDNRIYQTLRKNLKIFPKMKYELYKGSFFTTFPLLKLQPDIIYLDPPYDDELEEKIFEMLLNNIYSQKTIMILESHEKANFVVPKDFNIIKNKKYGRIFLYFFTIK